MANLYLREAQMNGVSAHPGVFLSDQSVVSFTGVFKTKRLNVSNAPSGTETPGSRKRHRSAELPSSTKSRRLGGSTTETPTTLKEQRDATLRRSKLTPSGTDTGIEAYSGPV
ncbi:hypothetical protein AC578_4425 [Pseudocercospora eumusae]|uniref:Uncharacterized protein n=1 Tax=Pseudocercospora eumusae TaxID=321146 RepID=A0A139HEW8_9PEZI|nr:hypothetical protein AC578_4425 [Pseudocercospora eumusae]